MRHDPVLRQFVTARLGTRWSPEQISQALRREYPDDPGRHLVPETIYQAIYRPELGGLHRDGLSRVLRTGRRRRKPHRRPDARRAGSLVGMTMIDKRPAEAADCTDHRGWTVRHGWDDLEVREGLRVRCGLRHLHPTQGGPRAPP